MAHDARLHPVGLHSSIVMTRDFHAVLYFRSSDRVKRVNPLFLMTAPNIPQCVIIPDCVKVQVMLFTQPWSYSLHRNVCTQVLIKCGMLQLLS